jgi:hypothetical protein
MLLSVFIPLILMNVSCLLLIVHRSGKGAFKNLTRALDKELKRATEPLKCQLVTAMLRGI